jgi:BirA family transcriptional regulator, biotin operon repressor / biotin---[acetyl-CoA-carboxylase] ligase
MSYPLSTIHYPLKGTIFEVGQHQHFDTIDSTNRRAMEAAAAGAPEGSVFTADEQTAGRGRGDHRWHSPAGEGLYVSMLLRPRIEPNDALWLSLIAGLAAHRAIAEVTTIACDIRWPNDIMLGAKKMGGILTELATEHGQVQHAVVGIGLNVNQSSFPVGLSTMATSLRAETDREWPREEILHALLRAFSDEYMRLLKEESARKRIIGEFEQASSYARGARVEVDDHGAAQFSGITEGLDERGFLKVRTADGMKTVISGGVRKLQG